MTPILVIVVAVLAAIALAYYVYNYVYAPKAVKLLISTTTSLYQTGLLDLLASKFVEEHLGVSISFLPVGSGHALQMAARGDACVVLVHAPSLEIQHLSSGAVSNHTIFAYNFFVIVGPLNDPANVSGAPSAVEAFRRIYEAAERGLAVFISRGDGSGTHVKELQLWNTLGLNPSGRPWYRECGCGMTEALIMANEMNGYTLSDMATFLKLKRDGRIPNLVELYSNSTELINVYSAYLSTRCSGPERDYAAKFIQFLASDEGQKLVASYGVDEYGRQLFYPAKGCEGWLSEVWSKLTEAPK